MLRHANFGCLAVLIVIGAGASPSAEHGPHSFHGRVTATWDNVFYGLIAPPATFQGGGPVTHLGKTLQTGVLLLDPPNANGLFPGEGAVTITAANGDELHMIYEGLLNAATGEGIGKIAFVGGTGRFAGGTGRFADATGGGTFYALMDLTQPANQPMTVLLDGMIDY